MNLTLILSYVWTDCRRVSNWYPERLWNVATSSYSVIDNSYTLQFTTTCTKPSQSVVVVWWRIQEYLSSSSMLTFSMAGDCPGTNSWSKSKSYILQRSVGHLFVWSPYLGLIIRFLLLSDSFVIVDVGRPFWREDKSLVYNHCWHSPAQSFILLPQTRELSGWRIRSSYLYPPRNRAAQLYPQPLGS
jgi:hypothetical protein